MIEQDITPYFNWTKNMLRSEERPVVSRILGIREWIRCFSATAARVDRFFQLGHEGSKTLPHSLVLDIIELDQATLTDALEAEGLLKNFILFWSAVADVYGSTRSPFETEAKRLDLLVEWALLLTALPGSNYPGLKLLAPRYRHERARLALAQLRRDKIDYADVALALQLVVEHEALLGVRWNGKAAAFTRVDKAAEQRTPSVREARNKFDGESANIRPCSPTAARTAVLVDEPALKFELYGNWQDHWRNTLP